MYDILALIHLSVAVSIIDVAFVHCPLQVLFLRKIDISTL